MPVLRDARGMSSEKDRTGIETRRWKQFGWNAGLRCPKNGETDSLAWANHFFRKALMVSN